MFLRSLRYTLDRALATFALTAFAWNISGAGCLTIPEVIKPPHAAASSPTQLLEGLPMRFEQNIGQTDPRVHFVSRGRGYTLFLTPTDAVLALRPALLAAKRAAQSPPPTNIPPGVLRMELVGAAPGACSVGIHPNGASANYLIGADQRRWQTRVPSFGRTRFQEVYPGIDLLYYGNQSSLEYDFVVQPGADYNCIQLRFSGSDCVELLPDGDLLLALRGGEVRWKKPVAYQDLPEGKRQEVACSYMLKPGNLVAFHAAGFDPNHPLIIDPVLAYATYLGGGQLDRGEAIATDAGGNIYITGQTVSVDFPTTNAFRNNSQNSSDAFVLKLNNTGSELIYSTYLGGSNVDIAFGIAVDSTGSAYVVGNTASLDFPVTNAFQSTLAGGEDDQDAFLAKLSPTGDALLYSTYFGGSDFDSGSDVAVDASNNAYITGMTGSTVDFPARNPFQANAGTFNDAFVARFNTAIVGANSLVYASWLGGNDPEEGKAIAIDSAGNAYITGTIYPDETVAPPSFPVQNALQPISGGSYEAFVAKINPAGSAVLFATYLGGTNEESGLDIALDSAGNIYVCGDTSSTNFPTVNAARDTIGSGGVFFETDGFVARIANDGSALAYSTYLGGDLNDAAAGLAVSPGGRIYVTGETRSGNFPVTADAFQTTYGGGFSDAFVAILDPARSGPDTLVFSSYLGGSDGDVATAIAMDANGDCFITGETSSGVDFPVSPGALQFEFAGGYSDSFMVKLSMQPALQIDRSNNQVVISWRAAPGAYRLEAAQALGSAWSPIGTGPVPSNGVNRVTLDVGAGNRFFRLQEQ